MKIKEIILLEEGNKSQVFLLKEGMFWRVYNQSAFLFTKYVKALKLTKKFYKVVDREMLYGGFPDTVLTKVLHSTDGVFTVLEQQEKLIKLVLIDEQKYIKEAVFIEWFSELKCQVPQKKQLTCEALVRDIQAFSILESTPIESQLFLVQLQKQVHGFI